MRLSNFNFSYTLLKSLYWCFSPWFLNSRWQKRISGQKRILEQNISVVHKMLLQLQQRLLKTYFQVQLSRCYSFWELRFSFFNVILLQYFVWLLEYFYYIVSSFCRFKWKLTKGMITCISQYEGLDHSCSFFWLIH